MLKPDMKTDIELCNIAEIVANRFRDMSEVNELCDRIARKCSRTENWTVFDFEENENTDQYNLYWSNFVLVQHKILAIVLDTLQH